MQYGTYAFAATLLAYLGPLHNPVDAQQRARESGSIVVAARADANSGATTSAPLARTIDVNFADVPLGRALEMLSAELGMRLSYPAEHPAWKSRVTVRSTNVRAEDAFALILRGTSLELRSAGGQWAIVERNAVRQADGTIQGRVVRSKTNQPVIGATVLLDDATKGVMTDQQGAFRLPAKVGEHRVTVRAVGLLKQSRSVTVTENAAATLEFVLDESSSLLDEVIVTGTVVATERKALPTPITVITAADLEQRNISRVDELFHGAVPGVIAIDLGTQSYDRELGQMVKSRVYSRGTGALDGKANPLKTYVDGVEIVDASYLGMIDPKSIERIEIITGPQAATIYGSGATGGVMQIFTKRGSGRSMPDFTLNLRYGVLQSNLSPSYTPSHDHSLNMTGGAGPEFSYSGNLSYGYTGQWQPNLFARRYGASAGITHARGPVTASGTASITSSTNGIIGFGAGAPCGYMGSFFGCFSTLLIKDATETGELTASNPAGWFTRQTSSANSQMLSFNLDVRPMALWQHHLTVGRATSAFEKNPAAPNYTRPSDTLYNGGISNGRRTTANYNMTLTPRFGIVSSTMTVGADGTWADESSVTGCALEKKSSSWSACTPTYTHSLDDRHWGGFTTIQVGVLDQLYLTYALRGEQNPNYGENHRIDWTPTQGITYTLEYGELSMKLLASYGSATRPPIETQRKQALATWCTGCTPGSWVSLLASPNLEPEYSRGPQGGIELYYGNLGSLTVNHYSQKTDNIIQPVPVSDSFFVEYSGGGGFYDVVRQNQNVATIRQMGWSGTGSLNLGPLTVRGTYSWDDSRVTAVNIGALGYGQYQPGQMFFGMPTHTGNITTTYAHGGTSATLAMDYVGEQLNSQAFFPALYLASSGVRLSMYSIRRTSLAQWEIAYPGYVKSHLTVTQRLNGWATATLNVKNLTNNFSSDVTGIFPSLGRQTLFGLTLRNPK